MADPLASHPSVAQPSHGCGVRAAKSLSGTGLPGDSELANRVEQLISALTDSHSFLEEPALRLFGDEVWTSEFTVPRSVGNYEILHPLGSGGMGTVYQAVQRQPNRTVALKSRGRRWKQDLRQQLQHESEVLGRLRHAYIAQVYEAGVDDSQPDHPVPYFAMEFVPDARTIRQYVRDCQLDVASILRLVCKVCQAVQHAPFRNHSSRPQTGQHPG